MTMVDLAHRVPMADAEQLARRIEGSKTAKAACDLLLEAAADINDPDERSGFWNRVEQELRGRLPRASQPSRTRLEPMTEAEAREFEHTTMPFGEHSGQTVGAVMAAYPHYLRWLSAQTFHDKLRRYV